MVATASPTPDVYNILEQVAKDINKVNNLEVAIPGEKSVKSDVSRWVPTDSVLLNLALGEGNYGMACGRIFEMFGDYSEGKSTIAQIMMNGFQKAGGISVLLDSEASWNRDRAIKMGHDPRRHLAIDIETCEMAFKIIGETIEKFRMTLQGKVPVLFVWDTIAATPTADEKQGDEFGSGMMFKPRLIRSELRRITPELKKIQASLLFINQTIEGNKPNRTGVKHTSGGGGIKFWSTQRIQVEKVGTFQDYVDKKQNLGITSQIKLVKNKLAAPYRTADLALNWETGLDARREVLNYLLDNTSVYNISGAYKKIVGFGDSDISFYEKDIDKVFDENPKLFEWCKDQVVSHWTTKETF